MSVFWSRALQQRRPRSNDSDGAPAPRGRVLRLKDGYNPNSSSVGSTIPAFLVVAVSSGALTVLLLNVLDTAGRLLRNKRKGQAERAEPSSQS